MKRIFILLFGIGLFQNAIAQNDSTATKSGEIIDGEIVIQKEKKIILPSANKVFKKAELKSFNTNPLKLDFDIFQPTFEWPDYTSDVPFKPVEKVYPTPNFQNYVKLGFGNYSSPLIEAGFFQQVEKMHLRAGLYHESFANGPINDTFSGSSNSSFDFSAKYKKGSFSVTPYIEVKKEQYHFYGNTDRINSGFSSETPDDGRFNRLTFGTIINGSKRGFQYHLNGMVYSASQKLKGGTLINKEPTAQALGGILVKLDTSFNTGFDVKAYASSYESGISYGRSLAQLSPWLEYSKENISIKGGFRIGTSQSNGTDVSGFYPFLNAELKFNPNWSVFGYTDSGLDWNGFDQIHAENQFLDDSLLILNEETPIKVGGGLKGRLFENFRVKGEVSYSKVNNLSFYVPSASDSSRFLLTYDNAATEIIRLEMNAEYTPNSVSTFGANLKLNGYTLDSLDKAWHLPTFELDIYSAYNINQKIILSANLISLSGIESPSNFNFGREKLPAIIDLNLGVNYLISERASAFIQANNLLNNEYERYLGYPVRGLTFKIGGKYRF